MKNFQDFAEKFSKFCWKLFFLFRKKFHFPFFLKISEIFFVEFSFDSGGKGGERILKFLSGRVILIQKVEKQGNIVKAYLDNNQLLGQLRQALHDAHRMQIRQAPTGLDLEGFLGVPQHPLKIARQHHLRLTGGEDLAQQLPIPLQLLELLLQNGGHGRIGHDVRDHSGLKQLPQVALVVGVHPEARLECRVTGSQRGQRLTLHGRAVQSILSVPQLDQRLDASFFFKITFKISIASGNKWNILKGPSLANDKNTVSN